MFTFQIIMNNFYILNWWLTDILNRKKWHLIHWMWHLVVWACCVDDFRHRVVDFLQIQSRQFRIVCFVHFDVPIMHYHIIPQELSKTVGFVVCSVYFNMFVILCNKFQCHNSIFAWNMFWISQWVVIKSLIPIMQRT